MDERRFDAWTKRLGVVSPRRATLRLLAGGGLALGNGLLQTVGAAAAHVRCRQVGKPCRRDRQCCSGRCRGKAGKQRCRAHHVGTCRTDLDYCAEPRTGCGENPDCRCFVTTGGAAFCGNPVGPGGSGCEVCERDADCVQRFGYPLGSACARACGPDEIVLCRPASRTSCVRPCTG